MSRVSPELFRSVWKHARQMHSQNDDAYAEFVKEARTALPGFADDPQFPFILRRVWMEGGPDGQDDWEASLLPVVRSRYRLFVRLIERGLKREALESWITPQLVYSTLSLWQRRVPYRMRVEHAVRMLRRTGRIADLGVLA